MTPNMCTAFRSLIPLLLIVAEVNVTPIGEDDDITIEDFKSKRRAQEIENSTSRTDETAEVDSAPPSRTEAGNIEERKKKLDADLKSAMEDEVDSGPAKKISEKREICDEVLEQLKNLPCDSPMVITCGGDGRNLYPCGRPAESPLRAALTDVDTIIGAPPALPSPVQTLPVSPIPSRPILLPPTRILTEAERRDRQKGIFEGLLRFGTVVNHIDSFLTEKGKTLIRGLNRMVASEEDSRFS